MSSPPTVTCTPSTPTPEAGPGDDSPARHRREHQGDNVTDWSLAIDFGTSLTTAAMSAAGSAPELVEIDNSRYLPSVVCLDEDGQILTGRVAVSQAAIFPERAE